MCALCPRKGSAMRRTTTGEFVHVLCAMSLPETRIRYSTVNYAIYVIAPGTDCGPIRILDTIDISTIPAARYDQVILFSFVLTNFQVCSICNKKVGVCISMHLNFLILSLSDCAERGCSVFFHIYCAKSKHLRVYTMPPIRGYCSLHSSKKRKSTKNAHLKIVTETPCMEEKKQLAHEPEHLSHKKHKHKHKHHEHKKEHKHDHKQKHKKDKNTQEHKKEHKKYHKEHKKEHKEHKKEHKEHKKEHNKDHNKEHNKDHKKHHKKIHKKEHKKEHKNKHVHNKEYQSHHKKHEHKHEKLAHKHKHEHKHDQELQPAVPDSTSTQLPDQLITVHKHQVKYLVLYF